MNEKLKESVKIAEIENAPYDPVWACIELAKRYLAIEDKGLVPKEKDRTKDLISPYLTGEADGYNACRQECILRIMKNMLDEVEIKECIIKAHTEWLRGNTKYTNIINHYSEAIYNEYERRWNND